MCEPVVGSAAFEQGAHFGQAFGFEHLRQEAVAVVVKTGQLGDAHVGKVVGSQAEETPAVGVDGGQFELVLQVGVLFLQALVIRVGLRFLQEASLTEEDGFYLKQVVAVFVYGPQGDVPGPGFKGVAVQSEPEVAG